MFRQLSDFSRFPDKDVAREWIEDVFQWMFRIKPEFKDHSAFSKKESELKQVLEKLFIQLGIKEAEAAEKVKTFFSSLDAIYEKLLKDLEAFVQFDPAAQSKEEVILAYPGFYTISIYRMAHQLWQMNMPIFPRMIAEIAHSKTGIDIHPAAQIGERFFIDHGTGIVIGETTQIGENVKIYQGVTLGALSVSKDKAEKKRHPTIGDGVIIYSNATILGGDTSIGKESVIGGNVWLTKSVPPYSFVYHKSEIVIKNTDAFPSPLNFSI
ncbi:MAG TPA: serine O-acetyltransferase EpsC [Bacteroidia bacterium]